MVCVPYDHILEWHCVLFCKIFLSCGLWSCQSAPSTVQLKSWLNAKCVLPGCCICPGYINWTKMTYFYQWGLNTTFSGIFYNLKEIHLLLQLLFKKLYIFTAPRHQSSFSCGHNLWSNLVNKNRLLELKLNLKKLDDTCMTMKYWTLLWGITMFTIKFNFKLTYQVQFVLPINHGYGALS